MAESDVVTVTFEPPGVTVVVPAGTTVLEAARHGGVQLPSTCGGAGTCGDCAVRVLKGEAAPPSPSEAAALAGAGRDVRLACLLRVTSPLTVRPIARIAMRPPSAGTRADARLAVSAAVDLGTTSISAVSLEAAGGRIAESTVPNPQRPFGGDVASRIATALSGGALELQELAARGIDEALAAAGVGPGAGRIVLAGNTAMTHLALGAEVGGLASHPYAGTLSGIARTIASRLGLQVPAPETSLVFMPPIAAFVGGDTTAAILATGLDTATDVHVLLDLGTNAEVVVASGGTLTVASAAAGPAFEAAGLACGGPASAGAIRGVRLDGGDLVLDVLGGGPAESICGSGALSLVAALLDAGHLEPAGRFVVPGPLADRFHHRGRVLALQLAGEPGGAHDVYLTQLDVRELQLAKAAVATALELTLEAAGVSWDAVSDVSIAGAFGTGVDGALLRRLGVLPARHGVPVAGVGDAALEGAARVSSHVELESHAERIAGEAHPVDLAAKQRFQKAFIAHTDLRELP
jgi:uncharacterized 2Fe-2S/4Fe-4S cluster protein (DUF4445 family)